MNKQDEINPALTKRVRTSRDRSIDYLVRQMTLQAAEITRLKAENAELRERLVAPVSFDGGELAKDLLELDEVA